MMLLDEDIEDDLLSSYPMYYKREGELLIYQNGKDNPKYLIEVRCIFIGGE